ncbi:copper resistance CopC family protein [Rothia kristinae]|uniref:copper resistance CopC family protein n=1 Tax=Rothia kristinae TaxID=37923 RepID=UPI0009E2E58F|nr:copper resistance CopC family protein [Rothia kristinae]
MGISRTPGAGARPDHRTRIRPAARRLPAALAALLALCLALFAGAPAAQAHDELLQADPADGATLEQAPDRITLTYSGDITALGNEVRVTDSQGKTVSTGDVTVDGTHVIQRISPDAGDETYTVSWRVVSSDGHPIEGTSSFTVGEGGAGQPAASSSAAAHDHDHGDHDAAEHHEHATSPASTESTEQTASPASAASDEGQGLPQWAIVLIAVVGVVVLLGVIALVVASLHARRTRDPERGDDAADGR